MSTPRFHILHLIRAIGIFSVAQYLTRKKLRILCYHAFSSGDEHLSAPLMFMRAETFKQRMEILKKRAIPVLPLDEAVRKLKRGEISHAEAVITLDDGWASNLTIGLPILETHAFPASIYVSTEHLEAGNEVFNVALAYMIHRTAAPTLTLTGLHPLLDGSYDIRNDSDKVVLALIRAAETAFPLPERQSLLRPIAHALGLDLNEVLKDGRFRLLSSDEMQEVVRRGFDIQLHTHTHHLPDSGFDAMAQEIVTNQKMLRSVIGAEPRHFCYPSGEYSQQHPQWLERLGIESATTCNPGLNSAKTSTMLLNRILDSDSRSNIAFEAEICGLRDLVRQLVPKSIRELPGLRKLIGFWRR